MSPIEELMQVRRQIAALEATELALMQDIIAASGHKKIGGATYDIDGYKVKIETKETINLDKSLLDQVWTVELPINRAFSYTPRKKDLDAAMMHGSPELRALLAKVVTTKPAKPVVKVEG